MYLERLLSIVEVVAGLGGSAAMTVSEIAEATGVPKPSLYRQVNDLVEAGLLEPRENGRYGIGMRARRLSDQFVSPDDVKRLALPLLKKAAREIGVAFFLARLRGASVDVIHAEVPVTGVSYLHPGIGARPLHACSCGKAIAAFCEGHALTQVLSGRLRAFTDHTKTDLGNIRDEFLTIRAQGYAECVEELEQGICSVAAPIKRADQPVEYSIGATGTLRVFTPSFRASLGSNLVAVCSEMSYLLEDQDVGAAHRAG
ncbi:IclR family transcriptional regulator [Roseobacter sp.]|uniref:IclR family transcriptional regulator n=1 Tax=Roseobacter sp. TaxID=1907202 RepID=UPI00385DFA07